MFRKAFFVLSLLCVSSLFTVSCGGGGDVDAKMKEFVATYAKLVYANYQEVEKGIKELQTAIDALVASPSAETLKTAKDKWLAVRNPYGATEVYRFYGGPIDDERGLEGRINAWPLDENYIDYVKDAEDSGIVNMTSAFPNIEEKVLSDANEKGGEKNVALGWHAIEFLLWGQDMSDTGAGQRPHTDYVTDGNGTAKNQDRRGAYLKLVTSILLKDVQTVMSDWAPDKADNYAGKMTSGDAKAALTKILTGMGKLSGGELSGERMTTPYTEKDQEEEHSCFSDNTKNDILYNAKGIQNVYLGKYGSVSGTSLDDLVRLKDTALADKMKQQLEASVAAIEAIPEPFDQAIKGDESSDGRKKVKAAIDALQTQAQTIAQIAKLFDITISTELEE
ncbi:MAG: iron-regulated protein [Deltaproteobacteria bacterium]|nr:MAG: iron-regulated protein [Deltaproteobacteria bacterium]